ncbi:peptide MFS transporter [candidate division KSB1 bacterium]|nr:peptide MFS transporter [candidate division KSB1 bacterium]
MTTHPVHRKHPAGLPVLFFTEMWERFSFYCMLSILTLYMDESLGFSNDIVGQIYGGYIGLVYFTPLIGGWIADRFTGFRKAILIGGVVMGLGHLLLAFSPLPTFFAGLICLIIGNGMFKPNISTILGNLYHDMPEKRDDAYNIFYMGINLGALASPLVAAYLRNNFGWHYAFGAAGIGMIISLAIFIGFKRHIIAGDITPGTKATQVRKHGIQLTPKQERERVTALMLIFAVVIVFWIAFDQNGYTLTFWARDNTDTSISPEIFQSINPFFILLFTPLLVRFWTFLRDRKREPATASKIAIGMLLTAAAYLIMTTAGFVGGDTGRVNVGWLVSTYAMITFAELCLSPMGLSLVSRLAPPHKQGMLMGAWFASTAIGGWLSGQVGVGWDKMAHSTFFLLLVVASLIAFGVLMLLLKRIHGTIDEAERMEAAAK